MAGSYVGEVRVWSGGELLARVPLRLRVWDFSLPKGRCIAAFLDPWRFVAERRYDDQAMRAVWPPFLQHLAEHRSAPLQPEAEPRRRWDDKGELVEIDFTPFDRAMEAYFGRYKLPVVVLPDFCLGYGHVPQETRFGKADEILSPAWKAKCTSYARAVAAPEGQGLER